MYLALNEIVMTELKAKRRKAIRFEIPLDAYTKKCVDKIRQLGFNSDSDAAIYALRRVAEEIDRGEIKAADIES